MKKLSTNNKKSAAEQLYAFIKLLIAVEIAKIRMKVAIIAVKNIHKRQSKKYLNPDYKTLIQYIIIIDRIVAKKRYFLKWENKKLRLKYHVIKYVIEEHVHAVNFKNFKKLKKKGYLQQYMRVDELRARAFYYSSLKRNYAQEFRAKNKAITYYVAYVKEQ